MRKIKYYFFFILYKINIISKKRWIKIANKEFEKLMEDNKEVFIRLKNY